MKLFYYGLTEAHASWIAAYIHLNKLPHDKIPSISALIEGEAFTPNNQQEHGIPVQMGLDERENEIFCIRLGKDPEIALQVIFHLLDEKDSLGEWRFYNVAPSKKNLLVKVSGFFAHFLKLSQFSRYITAKDIQKNYLEISSLVQKIKEWNE